VLAGETIARSYRVRPRRAHARARSYAATIRCCWGVSLVALILASRLQGIISGPIVKLAHTAATVAIDRNLLAARGQARNDKSVILIDGFNEMLSQIEARDDELRAAARRAGGARGRAGPPKLKKQ